MKFIQMRLVYDKTHTQLRINLIVNTLMIAFGIFVKSTNFFYTKMLLAAKALKK